MANIIEKQFFLLKNTVEMTIRIIRGTGMAMRMTIGIMIGRWVRMMMSMDDLPFKVIIQAIVLPAFPQSWLSMF